LGKLRRLPAIDWRFRTELIERWMAEKFILSLLSRPTREDCADAQTVPPAELRRIMLAAIMHHVNRRAPDLSAHGRRAGTRIILGNRVA
jgi:hypothetical protein